MTNISREVSTGNGPEKYFSSGATAKKVPFDSIPVIDFSAMFGTNEDEKMIVGEAVRKACTEAGFSILRSIMLIKE